MAEFYKLSTALPKCRITAPNAAGCSFILDRTGEKVGDILWHLPRITIYDDYEFADEVLEAIDKRGSTKFKSEVTE